MEFSNYYLAMDASRSLIPDSRKLKIKRLLWRRPNKITLAILGLFFVAGLSGLYVVSTVTNAPAVVSDNILGLTSSQHSNEDIITKVGKLTNLPEGETPKIAILNDVTKVADQPFFKNAMNGDLVLIYEGAKKVYVYRLSENKIIEIGPLVKPTPTPVDEVIEIRLNEKNIQETPTPTLIEVQSGSSQATESSEIDT